MKKFGKFIPLLLVILLIGVSIFGIVKYFSHRTKPINTNPDIVENIPIEPEDGPTEEPTVSYPVEDFNPSNDWDPAKISTDSAIIADFNNSTFGWHLVNFKEYEISKELPTMVFLIDENDRTKVTEEKIIYIEFLQKTETVHLFPMIISKPIKVALSAEQFENLVTNLDEINASKIFRADNYAFYIVAPESLESLLGSSNYYYDYATDDMIFANINFKTYYKKAEFINYAEEIGYPTDWIRSDEDRYYYELINGLAGDLDNVFYDYFNYYLIDYTTKNRFFQD